MKETAKTYTVQKGDTVYGVSLKNGITQANLRAWNNLKNDTIYVGQKLTVSKPGQTVSEAPKTEIKQPEEKEKEKEKDNEKEKEEEGPTAIENIRNAIGKRERSISTRTPLALPYEPPPAQRRASIQSDPDGQTGMSAHSPTRNQSQP